MAVVKVTFDDEVKLIKYTDGENDIGDPIEIPVKRVVLASKLDYRNKDYYQAMANGLKPSITFAINKYEYEGEKELEYEKKHYRIIDAFPVKQRSYREDISEFEALTLMCEGLVSK